MFHLHAWAYGGHVGWHHFACAEVYSICCKRDQLGDNYNMQRRLRLVITCLNCFSVLFCFLLFGWLVGWLVDWLVGWLGGWVGGWVVLYFFT